MGTLGLTLGALEIGILLASVLYGIATLQAFLYTERSFKDPAWLRTMIFLVWIFETTHTALSGIFLYSLTVTNYGVPSAIAGSYWPLALAVPVTSCIGATVQVFFAWRVRVLSGRFIIPLISWSGAVVHLVFGIMIAVFIMRSKTIPFFFMHYDWLVDAQLILDTAIDFLNTSSLCYLLWRRRSDYKETRRTVDKLIIYTLETGLLTSLCAIAVLACSLVMQENFIFLSIFMIYPKLFSNSLFSSLNSRRKLRRFAAGGIWSTDVYLDTQVSGVGTTSAGLESGINERASADSRKVFLTSIAGATKSWPQD